MQFILASQSPRRKEILSYFSIPFQQVSPPFDERSVPFLGDPNAYVVAIAKGKAESLWRDYPKAIILAADTIVFCKGKVFGKPQNKQEAYEMLQTLSGEWHSVYTGLTLLRGKESFIGVEETRVLFNSLTPYHIHRYIERLHWHDKAGSYAIQHAGGIIVKSIDGCFYNVMGLPINTLYTLLKHIEIDLWDYIQ